MVLGGERSTVGVVYMGREGVKRTWYDTILDWLKGKDQELQRRGCRITVGSGRETLTDT